MKFHYQARTQDGETQVGVIEASSKETALQVLERYGLYITLLEEAKKRPFYAKELEWFDRVSSRDAMLFSRELSIMFKAQVPLVVALQTIASQTKNKHLKEHIFEIAEAVEGGTPLSQALKKFHDVFSPFYMNMVRSGEASGKLSEVLEYLAEHLEREYYLAGKIRGAMMYPLFIVLTTVIILVLLTFLVIPSFLNIFQASSQKLPLLTKAVIGTALFIRSWWWALLVALIGAGYALSRYLNTAAGKRLWDTVSLKIPLLQSFLRMMYLARFAENLSTLITGGLPIVHALEIVKDIMGNDVYKDIVQEAREEVSKGNKISQVLQRYPDEFPPVFTQMVAVGETSGTLDTTLLDVVRFYQKELVNAVDSFLSVLEPALIVILGAVVGGIVASIILPLYQFSGAG